MDKVAIPSNRVKRSNRNAGGLEGRGLNRVAIPSNRVKRSNGRTMKGCTTCRHESQSPQIGSSVQMTAGGR